MEFEARDEVAMAGAALYTLSSQQAGGVRRHATASTAPHELEPIRDETGQMSFLHCERGHKLLVTLTVKHIAGNASSGDVADETRFNMAKNS